MPKKSTAVAAFKHLAQADSQRAAVFLEELPPEEAGILLAGLASDDASRCFNRLHLAFAGQVLTAVGPEKAGKLLSGLQPDAAADAFRAAGAASRSAILEALPPERREVLREFLSYPEDSAGLLMSTEFSAFPKGMKVKEVVQRLRAAVKKGSPPMYACVVTAAAFMAIAS